MKTASHALARQSLVRNVQETGQIRFFRGMGADLSHPNVRLVAYDALDNARAAGTIDILNHEIAQEILREFRTADEPSLLEMARQEVTALRRTVAVEVLQSNHPKAMLYVPEGTPHKLNVLHNRARFYMMSKAPDVQPPSYGVAPFVELVPTVLVVNPESGTLGHFMNLVYAGDAPDANAAGVLRTNMLIGLRFMRLFRERADWLEAEPKLKTSPREQQKRMARGKKPLSDVRYFSIDLSKLRLIREKDAEVEAAIRKAAEAPTGPHYELPHFVTGYKIEGRKGVEDYYRGGTLPQRTLLNSLHAAGRYEEEARARHAFGVKTPIRKVSVRRMKPETPEHG
jgi:hypothetical protein